MEKKTFQSISIGFAALAVLLLALVWFLAYLHRDFTTANPFVFWLIKNRLTLSIITMLISVVSGYALATYTNLKLSETQTKTEEVITLLKQFLTEEEGTIIRYLIENNNKVLQSELSRIEGLTRVKVHRTLKKMEDQGLVTITSRGKTNSIRLHETVAKVLG